MARRKSSQKHVLDEKNAMGMVNASNDNEMKS